MDFYDTDINIKYWYVHSYQVILYHMKRCSCGYLWRMGILSLVRRFRCPTVPRQYPFDCGIRVRISLCRTIGQLYLRTSEL